MKVAPTFSQLTVSAYLDVAKSQLSNIKFLLLKAQDVSDTMSIEEVTAIAFASVIFGGAVWSSLPKMFDSLSAEIL